MNQGIRKNSALKIYSLQALPSPATGLARKVVESSSLEGFERLIDMVLGDMV